MVDCDVTIIGGGVIGAAVAYELSQRESSGIMCLLERSSKFPGENQTSRNSGVIHAGIYYDSSYSPLKARLCVEGNRLLYEFCRVHNIPSNQTGKLVVATNSEEDISLDDILIRSQENEVPGVEKISGRQAQELEPHINAYSALWVPTSGIVDPISLVCKLQTLAGLGEYFLVGTDVVDITPDDGEFIVSASTTGTGKYTFSTKHVINAAGLHSDEIAKMVNPHFPFEIFPVRGESAKFYQSRTGINVSRNIYPAPIFYSKPDGSKHLTVGAHLTPTFSVELDELGTEVTVGPLNRKKGDEVGKDDYGSDLATPSAFLAEVRKYFPGISLNDLQLHQTGIQAVLANGQDFHIARDEVHPNMINLVGICSPGLTASLAIAKRVRSTLES